MKSAGFKVVAAVDIDPVATDTFEANHPEAKVVRDDIRNITGQDLLRSTGERKVSLMAGCAPCQGFSSLTRKWKKDDPRNELVLEMTRLIKEILPDAVTMENVPGLATVGKKIFDQFLEELRESGYYSNWKILQMADFGVPQSRRRLVLTAGRGFFIPLPEPTHSSRRNVDSLKPWVTLKETISDFSAPVTMSEAEKRGGPQSFNWHVVRDLQPQTMARLEAAVPGETWLGLDESIRPECHRNGYTGFTNVYGRMQWDQASVTITAGCTTPCKGRFGHPDKSRTTISVREAACIQTFPESYHFTTDYMGPVCNLIGNAVPPKFATALGESILSSIEAHYGALARRS